MSILNSKEISDSSLDLESISSSADRGMIDSISEVSNELSITQDVEDLTDKFSKAGLHDRSSTSFTSSDTSKWKGKSGGWRGGYRNNYRANKTFYRYRPKYQPSFIKERQGPLDQRRDIWVYRIDTPLALKIRKRLKTQCEKDMFDIQQGKLIEPENQEVFNKLATELCRHHLEGIALPVTDFWKYAIAKRKEGSELGIVELRREWNGKVSFDDREKDFESEHKLYLEYENFQATRLKILNELRALLKKPKVTSEIKYKGALEFVFEDFKNSIKSSNVFTAKSTLQIELIELWLKLSPTEKKYYLARRRLGREIARHKAEKEKLEEYIELLKTTLAKENKKAAPSKS